MEELFYANKVDFVFVGHQHSYERTEPVHQGNAVCDGPVHITIGDGGNSHGPGSPLIPEVSEWSAFREFSFGYGSLQLKSPDEAIWSWHRNQDNDTVVADLVEYKSALSRCRAEQSS